MWLTVKLMENYYGRVDCPKCAGPWSFHPSGACNAMWLTWFWGILAWLFAARFLNWLIHFWSAPFIVCSFSSPSGDQWCQIVLFIYFFINWNRRNFHVTRKLPRSCWLIISKLTGLKLNHDMKPIYLAALHPVHLRISWCAHRAQRVCNRQINCM